MAGSPLSPPQPSGLAWGLLGVAGFSLTVPLTRIAVGEGALSPLFVGSGRAVIAGTLAVLALRLTHQRMPGAAQWWRLAVVAAGVVYGFPLLTSYALTEAGAGHGAVVIAVLPAATAVASTIRGRERPSPAFWALAVLGAVAAVVFATVSGTGPVGLAWPDLLLLGAVVMGAAGYAEGGLLSREIGAWQTISWALVLALPGMAVLAVWSATADPPHAGPAEWSSFLYLGTVSMFLGFFAWYRGLAIGPMVTVSQVQLLQPVMTIGAAAVLVGEPLTPTTALGALGVIACAALTVRSRSGLRS